MDTPFTNPDGSTHRVVILSEQDWNANGTRLASLRAIAKKQDERIKELVADVAARDLVNADALQRLNNLREIRRNEKRAEIEKDLILPGDSRYDNTQGT